MGTITFHLENFAKITSADLDLNGITVVVGKNNSGKSTVGKALYALCDIARNVDGLVLDSLATSMWKAAKDANLYVNRLTLQRIVDQVTSKSATFLEGLHSLREKMRNTWEMEKRDPKTKGQLPAFRSQIQAIMDLPLPRYRNAVVWEYFQHVFHSQVLSAFEHQGDTMAAIDGAGGVRCVFHATTAQYEETAPIQWRVYYLNGPRALNLVNSDGQLVGLEECEKDLVKALRKARKGNSTPGLVDPRQVANRDKFVRLQECFDQVLPGFNEVRNGGRFALPQAGCKEAILYENLSSGLKSFVLLRRLLMEGLLSEGDILILDEPEVNLHPEWQIVYAELVVLLCKIFGVKILLTSHSVDFIHALSLYAKLHKQENKLALYKSELQDNGAAKISHVPGNDWERLFDEFVNAIDILEGLRGRLEEDG